MNSWAAKATDSGRSSASCFLADGATLNAYRRSLKGAPARRHRGREALFVFALSSGEFGVGPGQCLHGGRVREHRDGLLKRLQIIDSEQHGRRPTMHGNRDPLMLGAHQGDQLGETRLHLGEGIHSCHWSQV